MTEGFRCPSCGFRIFSRRIAKCESCGAPLPVALGLTSEQVAALDAEDDRIRKAGAAFARRNAPRGSIGGDGGAAGGDAGCGGDGGGCD
jgi:hypothetical protein